MAQKNFLGRRKTSTARLYIQSGKGSIVVNGKDFKQYFPTLSLQNTVTLPLQMTETTGKFDVVVTVAGGGIAGQAGAVQLAMARAIDGMVEDKHTTLKTNNFLTRDDRMVERKKYGRPKARKRFQFSKR